MNIQQILINSRKNPIDILSINHEPNTGDFIIGVVRGKVRAHAAVTPTTLEIEESELRSGIEAAYEKLEKKSTPR